jgi:O-6-methylguanine DNA methyltransferase
MNGMKKNLFREKVLAIVSKIPKGKTMTYKQVAAKAGHAGAACGVGAIMAANKDKAVPCHRVIRSDGKISGYNGINGDKEQLLRKEGAIK